MYYQLFCFVWVLLLLISSGFSQNVEPLPPDSKLPQLLAHLDSEPLFVIAVQDVRILQEKLLSANLIKMLGDPNYAQGIKIMEALVNEQLGANLSDFWLQFKRLMSGPIVIALLANPPDAQDPSGSNAVSGGDHPPFKLVCLALTPMNDTARELSALWPNVPPQANKLLPVIRFQAVSEQDSPATSRIPPWAMAPFWQNMNDICVRISSRKLAQVLQPLKISLLEKGVPREGDHGAQTPSPAPPFQAGEKGLAAPPSQAQGGVPWIDFLIELARADLDSIELGLQVKGENFSEELRLGVVPGSESTFIRVLRLLREDPRPWDALTLALPGQQDVAVLLQSNPGALGSDLPLATQALERFLRGKRWTRTKGHFPESLDPLRFDFLLDRLQGTFGLVGRPALSGDLRLIAVGGMKPGGVEFWRECLIKGLGNAGATFETLQSALKIGETAPLGATFQGRGLFSAPVIGLSPGWSWLCSSSAAYQDLTAALKSGKTLNSEQSGLIGSSAWRSGDALRVQIELERLMKLAYAFWLLSGEDGPTIGSWKVPADLLPQPQVFSGHLGQLRAGLCRQANTIVVYSNCVVPGTSVMLASILRELAESIDSSRKYNASGPKE